MRASIGKKRGSRSAPKIALAHGRRKKTNAKAASMETPVFTMATPEAITKDVSINCDNGG